MSGVIATIPAPACQRYDAIQSDSKNTTITNEICIQPHAGTLENGIARLPQVIIASPDEVQLAKWDAGNSR
jgi:hypothetical protein